MNGGDRWLGSIMWKGRLLHVDEVRRLGRYATCETGDRMLHEYDREQFWVTDLRADEPERRLNSDPSSVPKGSWLHGPMCDCEGCQAGSG